MARERFAVGDWVRHVDFPAQPGIVIEVMEEVDTLGEPYQRLMVQPFDPGRYSWHASTRWGSIMKLPKGDQG